MKLFRRLARAIGFKLVHMGTVGTRQAIGVGFDDSIPGSPTVILESLGAQFLLTPAEASRLGFELMLKAGTSHLRSPGKPPIHVTKASLVPQPSAN